MFGRKPKKSHDEHWHDVLMGEAQGHVCWRPWMRRISRSIPSDPRCKLCDTPFGPPGNLMRFIGFGPSPLNRRICSGCIRALERRPGGAEIELSIMFADVRGSTGLAERMAAGEFSELLATLLRRSREGCRPVERHRRQVRRRSGCRALHPLLHRRRPRRGCDRGHARAARRDRPLRGRALDPRWRRHPHGRGLRGGDRRRRRPGLHRPGGRRQHGRAARRLGGNRRDPRQQRRGGVGEACHGGPPGAGAASPRARGERRGLGGHALRRISMNSHSRPPVRCM